MKNILITGGAGYIGSILTKRLVSNGHKVVVIDDLSSGRKSNLPNKGVVFYKTNILDRNVENIFKKHKFDLVFHMAALKSVNESLKNPLRFAEVNILGSINIIEACVRYKVFNLVFMSTAGVYGDYIPKGGQDEKQITLPSSPYAASKVAIEQYLAFYKNKKIRPMVFRFANVYGKGGVSKIYGAVDKFIWQIKNGETIHISGTGNQTRDFIYIEDLVDLCEIVAKKYPQNLGNDFIFNVSTGKETRINLLIGLIQRMSGQKVQQKYDDNIPVGQSRSVLSPNFTKNRLGWTAKTGIKEGVSKII